MTMVALWAAAAAVVAAIVTGLARRRHRTRSLAERSAELEQLSAELYRANRAKSEFLANVSHELRTPLAAIVGFVDLLREGAYGELTPRQIGPVERIESSANHLRELVEQVLDLSKMAAGRLEVHTELIKPRPFVIDVASEVEPLLNEKKLALSIAVPATLPRIAADPTHLRRILVNLLGNAIKFTPAGSVVVRASLVSDGDLGSFPGAGNRAPLLATSGPWVALQVIDTGVGIAGKDLERIFEEFEQVNAGPRGDSMRRGTGLGLAISRRLARLLDGDLTVESVEGRGSVFTVWVPADSPTRVPRAIP
jgi:signal transduction histidine kinase